MTDIKLGLFSKKEHQFYKFLIEECFKKENRKFQTNELIDKIKPLSNLNKRVESGDSLLSLLHLLDNQSYLPSFERLKDN